MTITVIMLGKFVDTVLLCNIKWEAKNEGYFCKIPIIKQDTKFISQTFGQTNF